MTNSNANNGVMNSAVENAKVANVKYLYYHPGSKGFIDADGVIVSVIVAKVSVNLRDQIVTTILKDVNGNEYTRTGDFYLFDTAADFENDVKSSDNKRYRISAGELLQWAGGNKTAFCETTVIDYNDEDGSSNIYLNVWTCENGKASLTPVLINSVAWDEDGKHVEDGDLPEKYWSSKAEVYKWNEYKLIDEDGDEFVEKSAEIRLAPSTTQSDILDTLKNSFELAAAAGLIIFVSPNGTLKAFNTENVVTNSAGASMADLCGDQVLLDSVELANVGVTLQVNNYDARLLLKPTERQLKAYKKAHPGA